jgi:hypothetical protein
LLHGETAQGVSVNVDDFVVNAEAPVPAIKNKVTLTNYFLRCGFILM